MTIPAAAWPAIGAIGGSLINAFANRSSRSMDSMFPGLSEASQRALEYDRQKEFAQHGIQWRVDDAKAAGVHPVFALSGGGAAYAPQAVSVNAPQRSFSTDFAAMGQNIGRAVAAASTAEDRAESELRQSVAISQIYRNISEGDMFRQAGNPRQPIGPGIPSVVPNALDEISGGGQLKVEPHTVTSSDDSDRSLGAGVINPGWSRYTFKDTDGNDRSVVLPLGNSASESMESLGDSPFLLYATIKENMHRDPEFAYRFRHLWPGGELFATWARALERAGQYYLNQKKAAGQAAWIADQWRSGRDRGVNWRTGKGGN